jgi:protein involved in polysaccharide export with SLBB domain
MADVADKQIKRLRALIQEAETNLAAANELLISLVGDEENVHANISEQVLGKVIEGVFDGQNMVGSDGKTYPVPANYASKSKLVQGDILKLTIADDGAFLYKQIGPIPRKQVVGTLKLEGGHYFVSVGNRDFRVLLASVTYFKARPGDQVSVNVPEDDSLAEWAALEAAL